MSGDNRIKAFCLRQGYAIPTDSELEQFPLEFRAFESDDINERLAMGCALWRWLVNRGNQP